MSGSSKNDWIFDVVLAEAVDTQRNAAPIRHVGLKIITCPSYNLHLSLAGVPRRWVDLVFHGTKFKKLSS
jgi:hypothetical protein